MEVLRAAIEALPADEPTVRVIPDRKIGLSRVVIEAGPGANCAEMAELARDIRAAVLITELESTLR